jgi:hypothetical protein
MYEQTVNLRGANWLVRVQYMRGVGGRGWDYCIFMNGRFVTGAGHFQRRDDAILRAGAALVEQSLDMPTEARLVA